METILNFINYVYDYFFKEEEEVVHYGYVSLVEPSEQEVNNLIYETIKEIKLDNDIFDLNIRYINLIKDDVHDENSSQVIDEDVDEDDDENDNDGMKVLVSS